MWLFYLLALIVLAAAYGAYLAIAVPVTVAAAVVVYGAGMPIAYLAGLGRVLVTRPPELAAPKRSPRLAAEPDPALLQYFYGPAVTDAEHAIRVAYANCQMLWNYGVRKGRRCFIGDKASLTVTVPLGISGAVGMAIGTVIGTVATAGCALSHLLVVGISAVSARAAGKALRGVDSALLRVKNIRMVCPACFERVPYPAYACPGPRCTRRHRDVRPGPFGVLRRRCHCGTAMNTLLLFGSSRMVAYCPHKGCGHSLEHRPGEAPEIVLPFFGAAGAGKTRLLFSMVTQLRLWADTEQLTAEFGDSTTSRELNVADYVLRSGSMTVKTPVGLPRAHVIRLSSNKRTWILHMFDAAGERFYRTDRTQELRYFSKARTFILVIDPLSVEAFWERLPAARQAELELARSTAPSPDLAYQQTHQEIEAMGVQLKKVRLAVVFSRADLIDTPSGDVAEWAGSQLGLGNLVRSVRQNFKETCFLHTAAVMADGAVHESVAALMRWVLAPEGPQLPGATS
jgi:hypothetical protein